MDLNTGSYSPDEVLVIVSHKSLGVDHVVGGFSEGTFITAERAEPTSVSVRAVRGSGGRIKRVIREGTITLNLNSMSSSNDVLDKLFQLDEISNDTTGFFTLSIADKTGRSWVYGKECYISIQPSAEFSTEESQKSWQIICGNLQIEHGGNAVIPEEIVAQIEALGFTVPERWRE